MTTRVGTRKLVRLGGEESGAGLVEFALTLWVLILVLFGIYQWAFALYAYHFTSFAAQQGTRFAMVRGYTWSKNKTTNCSSSAPPSFTMVYDCTASNSDIQNFVQSLATGGINPGNVTVSSSWPGTNPDGVATGCTTYPNSQGCMVKVTVSYTCNYIPFLPKASVTMSATSEKVILQ